MVHRLYLKGVKMQMTLTFDMDEPDQLENAIVAIHAQDLYLSLWDLDKWLRSKVKYATKGGERINAFSDVREHLRDLMHGRGVNLDMLS